MWCSGYCSPRYESENRAGVYSEKCQMQLSSVSSVEWCNHSLVCYFHTQYKTHECTQPKHDLIAQVSQFHCLVQRHLSWFNVRPHTARIVIRDHLQARQIPGMEWPACSPDLTPIKLLWNLMGNSMRSIQSAWPTTNLPWTMGCNPRDQDHQTDLQHEEKVPSYHGGIWRINTVLISMRALGQVLIYQV